ncbi:AAA family ATPase [Blastopirellula marina]|uniref:Uncharacterized AAA domain-containing protein ycf46 n=1 Tax=Blastopirellula marina TaxID=124 RepID=A0A2S8GHB5_9BACT|nr:AAA family ATPase [Blastopirellula marina]PQO43833.1 AAA family ATPase [Blastopirellula marina]
MNLAERLSEYVRACFTGIWIESHEHQDALAEIAQLCRQEDWRLASWNIAAGLRISDEPAAAGSDPLSAIAALDTMAVADGAAILVLENFHRFLQSAEVIQALARQIIAGKQNRTFVVILSPLAKIPAELEKLLVVLEHELPGRDQLLEIATGVATEEGELPSSDELERTLDAATGLTRYEAEGAFSLSLIREGRVTADAIWELKTQALKKSGLIELHRGAERFDQLGGLAAIKDFCRRSLAAPDRSNVRNRPRGVLLLSPPGCGKSQFAKALGNEVGRPTLVLDVGSLMGSLVGETERNVREALRIVDAMAPCVLFVDELEKGLGNASNGSGDSGVSVRMLGRLLSWMNDHSSDVYVIATCNEIAKLPPELTRAERFDGVFFLDLPERAEKDAIWRMYLDAYGLDFNQSLPPDDQFTGAEIKSCCRLAALLDLSVCDAARNVVPVAVTAAESVTRLRNWASGRCLDAANGGVYRAASPKSARRRIPRDASKN